MRRTSRPGQADPLTAIASSLGDGSLDSLSGNLRGLLIHTLPSPLYTDASHWGQQKEVQAGVTWKGKDNRYSVIAYVKNAFNTLGYDGGSTSTRYSGVYSAATIAAAGMTAGLPGSVPGTFNAVQKTPTFNGISTTYNLTPPRTFGVEFQYRF